MSAKKTRLIYPRGPRATTKEHAGDFSRRENYFLVKLRARKTAYNIRASPTVKEGLRGGGRVATRCEGEGARRRERGWERGRTEPLSVLKGECESRDTSRLELQGSKDVGTCRDLQSRNYGYTIGNDTAGARALDSRAIISASQVPHETARYTIGVNSSTNYGHDDGTGNTWTTNYGFRRRCDRIFFYFACSVPSAFCRPRNPPMSPPATPIHTAFGCNGGFVGHL